MPKKCITCHMYKEEKGKSKEPLESGGHTFRLDDKVCLKCHKNPKTLVEESNKKTSVLLKRLKALLDNTTDKTSRAYRTAKSNYDLVIADGEIGLHNPTYAQALLKYSISLLATESVWK